MAVSQSSVAMPPMPTPAARCLAEIIWLPFTWRGPLVAGFISAVAFATILPVVSGLLIAGASSAANDLVVGLSGRQLDERMRLRISRIAAMALGVLGILLGLACEGQNVAYLLALATAIAASANFPLLLLAIYWDGLTTRGAVVGGTVGLVSSVVLTAMGQLSGQKYWVLVPRSFRTTRRHSSRYPSRCLSA